VNCDLTFGIYASVERYLGNSEIAVAASRRAIELSATPRPWRPASISDPRPSLSQFGGDRAYLTSLSGFGFQSLTLTTSTSHGLS
jgi:hypothetical protein